MTHRLRTTTDAVAVGRRGYCTGDPPPAAAGSRSRKWRGDRSTHGLWTLALLHACLLLLWAGVFLLVLYCTSPSSEILDARARHAEQCNSDARARRPKRRLSRARLLLSTPRSRSDSIHWLRETERIMHGHANAIVFGRCVRLHGHAASTFASISLYVRTYTRMLVYIKL